MFQSDSPLDAVQVERSSLVGDITFDHFEQFSDNQITLTEETYCKYISIARHKVGTGTITWRNHLPQSSKASSIRKCIIVID